MNRRSLMTLPGPFWFLVEPFPWEDLYYGELEGEGGAEQPRICSLIYGEKQDFILWGGVTPGVRKCSVFLMSLAFPSCFMIYINSSSPTECSLTFVSLLPFQNGKSISNRVSLR